MRDRLRVRKERYFRVWMGLRGRQVWRHCDSSLSSEKSLSNEDRVLRVIAVLGG